MYHGLVKPYFDIHEDLIDNKIADVTANVRSRSWSLLMKFSKQLLRNSSLEIGSIVLGASIINSFAAKANDDNTLELKDPYLDPLESGVEVDSGFFINDLLKSQLMILHPHKIFLDLITERSNLTFRDSEPSPASSVDGDGSLLELLARISLYNCTLCTHPQDPHLLIAEWTNATLEHEKILLKFSQVESSTASVSVDQGLGRVGEILEQACLTARVKVFHSLTKLCKRLHERYLHTQTRCAFQRMKERGRERGEEGTTNGRESCSSGNDFSETWKDSQPEEGEG